MKKARSLNIGVQVLPLVGDAYQVMDKAIEVLQVSGVQYEVGLQETVLEGDDLDQLLEVAKSAHFAFLESGAKK